MTRLRGTDPVAVVIGSSAVDLDSVVASIAYAYLLDREISSLGPVFPYLPVPREELSTRVEVERLFEREGLSTSTLVFADDVDLEDLLDRREGELILVDTQGDDLAPALSERVTEVIDHHPLNQPAYAEAGPEPSRPLRRRIVEPVGSACTLVAEQILERKPGILDRQLAALLLAAVLLDTVNLDWNTGRVTVKDQQTAELLIKAGGVDTTGLYEDLVRARSDVEGLSSAQLLERDYKERTAGSLRFGMSSVPILIDAWSRRDRRLERTLSVFMSGKDLDLLVVLLYRPGDGFERQLALCSTDGKLLDRVVAELSEPLGLTEIPPRIRGGQASKQAGLSGVRRTAIRRFSQAENSVSRKRIEPRLREILENR